VSAPTFLVIGAARSGTTYLTRQLALHPQILLSDPKEPHFLAFAGERLAFTGPGDGESINRRAVTDEARWLDLFATADPAVCQRGEGSVSTLYFADASVASIRRTCPDVRMIALLRDPVERASSAHQYWTSRGFETETLSRGLDREHERIAAGYHHIWHYTTMGFYSRQLPAFFDAFGRDRLLVLGYEDFMADRTAGLDQCLDFLGIDPWRSPDLNLDVNAGGQPRSRLGAVALRRVRTVEPVRRVVRAVVPFGVRERVRSANVRKTDMAEADRRRLEEVFSDERAALADLLGDDAPGWVRS